MDADETPPPCWSVVLPVKPLRLAKTRLALPAELRADVVLAMALDTASAALACPAVALVVVVTDDVRAAAGLGRLGALVVPDVPDAGLNPALAYGVSLASARRPDCGAATLSADLPALRPAELSLALAAAAAHPRAMVADAAGNGTTLLTALPGVLLAPAYGPQSRRRHEAGGHVVVETGGIDSVRRDVDTLGDLASLRRTGIGPHTAGLLARLDAVLARADG